MQSLNVLLKTINKLINVQIFRGLKYVLNIYYQVGIVDFILFLATK